MGLYSWLADKYHRARPSVIFPAADAPKEPQKPVMGPPKPRLAVLRDSELNRLLDKHMPQQTTNDFRGLIKVYDNTIIEFPHLKGITVAQWAIETAWGTSRAAREDGNFAGMKWSEGDRKYGTPSKHSGSDGYEQTRYTHFDTHAAFIQAYWARLDRVSAYKGWRNNTQNPIRFIGAIGPPWVYYHSEEYISNVVQLWRGRTRFLFGE